MFGLNFIFEMNFDVIVGMLVLVLRLYAFSFCKGSSDDDNGLTTRIRCQRRDGEYKYTVSFEVYLPPLSNITSELDFPAEVSSEPIDYLLKLNSVE